MKRGIYEENLFVSAKLVPFKLGSTGRIIIIIKKETSYPTRKVSAAR
jgi:hypothetical protein